MVDEGFDTSYEADIQDSMEVTNEMPEDIEPYSATPLTEQMVIEDNGDINSIANIQDRQEATEELPADIEPYMATPLSEQMVIEENGDIRSIQDIMERLEQNDFQEALPDVNTDGETERISVEELLKSDAELLEQQELNKPENLTESMDPLTDTEAPFEKAFADMIDAMSLDEMKMERDKLIALGALDGESISRQYEVFNAEQNEQQHFDAVTDGLNADQLRRMKDKLQAGDQELLDLLRPEDTSEGDGAQKVKRR